MANLKAQYASIELPDIITYCDTVSRFGSLGLRARNHDRCNGDFCFDGEHDFIQILHPLPAFAAHFRHSFSSSQTFSQTVNSHVHG